LEPGAGVSGRAWADVQIIEEEKAIDYCHMIKTDCGDGCFCVVAMIGEASMLDGHEHNVDEDFGHIWEYIDSPFVCGVGASGRVCLKEIENVGGGVGDFDFLNCEFGGLCLE
jgi:hypothetical protein